MLAACVAAGDSEYHSVVCKHWSIYKYTIIAVTPGLSFLQNLRIKTSYAETKCKIVSIKLRDHDSKLRDKILTAGSVYSRMRDRVSPLCPQIHQDDLNGEYVLAKLIWRSFILIVGRSQQKKTFQCQFRVTYRPDQCILK